MANNSFQKNDTFNSFNDFNVKLQQYKETSGNMFSVKNSLKKKKLEGELNAGSLIYKRLEFTCKSKG